jgi:hypothetical protein
MKSILFAVLLFVSAESFAQWFPATVRITSLQGAVTAEVSNPYLRPIICNGQVFGQTVQGPVFNAFFSEQWMPVGSYRYAYVQTNTRLAPFVGGWAEIYCRYSW